MIQETVWTDLQPLGSQAPKSQGYIKTNLANVFIKRSSSSVAAPIMFAKKEDSGLQQCVDNRALNSATVKSQIPRPLRSEMCDRMSCERIFPMLDRWITDHRLRINEPREFHTAFWTCYGQVEYRVMPFGLTNIPATFPAYIDDSLGPYIDDVAVCYLDIILIYSTNEKEHEDHIQNVIQQL